MSPRPRSIKIATLMQSGAGSVVDSILMESKRVMEEEVMVMEEEEMVMEEVASLRRKGSHKELSSPGTGALQQVSC